MVAIYIYIPYSNSKRVGDETVMIAHVAEAGEARGRVVLRFCANSPSKAAIGAAFTVAEAFQSEVESLYIEDRELLDMARYSFATEISFTGRRRALSQRALRGDFLSVFSVARKHIKSVAEQCSVPLQERYVRDEPIQALAAACAQKGPWNVVALAEAFSARSGTALQELFEMVTDTTGVILAGPCARQRIAGPIVIVVEDIERFPGMLRAGERLSALKGNPITLLPVAETMNKLMQLSGEIRLALAHRTDVSIASAPPTSGEAAVVAEEIRRLKSGFVIAKFGGHAVPAQSSLRPLAAVLECPLFLVR